MQPPSTDKRASTLTQIVFWTFAMVHRRAQVPIVIVADVQLVMFAVSVLLYFPRASSLENSVLVRDVSKFLLHLISCCCSRNGQPMSSQHAAQMILSPSM